MWFILTAQWVAAAGLEPTSLIIPSNYRFQEAAIKSGAKNTTK
jgi:hypothetical protein